MKKFRVGILGATGMVGQRFMSLLENHPWFSVGVLAASSRSRGKKYRDATRGRWLLSTPIPQSMEGIIVDSVEEDFKKIISKVDVVFCALDAQKSTIQAIENRYAASGIPVISNNSAHRWTDDVPMIMPEINPHHLKLIAIQRKKRGWGKGFIVVKPNCSLQSYVPVIWALKAFGPINVSVTTLQAISGAGKTFATWPEMVDNCIPFISGEEEKTEQEPLKILGTVVGSRIEIAAKPVISATCIRVACSDGHMASVAVKFERKPSLAEILRAIRTYENPLAKLNLPSAPREFIRVFSQDDRPQTNIDRNYEHAMGITCGRFREDTYFDWKFIALSHNTIRGAAGGAVLTAELLVKKGYIQ